MIYFGVLFGIVYLALMGVILYGINESAKELDGILGGGYNREQAEKFNKEWDEKTLRWVRKALEDVMPKNSDRADKGTQQYL